MNDYLKKRMEFINAGRPLPEKKKYSIPKISKKRQEKIDEQKKAGGDSELDLFFEQMRKKLRGKCLFCGGATTWKNDDLWRVAVAHLLPKRHFKSVATNEDNWVELCWNCHTDFDNNKITWILLKDSKEWDTLSEKLLNIIPLITQEERKNKLYDKLCQLVYGKTT